MKKSLTVKVLGYPIFRSSYSENVKVLQHYFGRKNCKRCGDPICRGNRTGLCQSCWGSWLGCHTRVLKDAKCSRGLVDKNGKA